MSSVRARLGLLVAVVASILVPIVLSPPAKAAAMVPGDWMVSRFDAGADGAIFTHGWNAMGTRNGRDPLVLGTIMRKSNELTQDDVYEPELNLVPINGMHVRTSSGAGGLDVQAYPNDRGTWTYSQGKYLTLEPFESVTLVSFVAGSQNTSESLNWTLYLGHVTVSTATGFGSQILHQIDREGSGLGVDAGYASAGSSTQVKAPAAGIVGGYTRVCEYCTMEWKSPDGRSGVTTAKGATYANMGYRERAGSRFFAGPAGQWSWKWEGLQVDPRVSNQPLGAFAPVGSAWKDFEEIGDFGGGATDWVVATIKAGPSGANTPIIKSLGTIVRPAGNDVVFGVGRAGTADSYVDVSALGDDGFSARTTDGLGSVNVEVRANPASQGPFSVTWYPPPMAAGEEKTLLILTAGGIIADGSVSAVSDNGGSLTVTNVRQGNGSRAITPAGPGKGGTAIDADRALVGSGESRATVPSGLVGGLSFRCDRCTETWQSPDGRSGTYSHEDRVVTSTGSGTFTFAGPPGPWQWTWTGVNVDAAGAAGLIGAYAPIGAGWNAFG